MSPGPVDARESCGADAVGLPVAEAREVRHRDDARGSGRTPQLTGDQIAHVGDAVAARRDDDRHLPPLVVVRRHHDHLAERRHSPDDALDGVEEHLLAPGDDHVVRPPAHRHPPVDDVAQITRAIPADAAVLVEGRRGPLLISDVAFGQRRSADLEQPLHGPHGRRPDGDAVVDATPRGLTGTVGGRQPSAERLRAFPKAGIERLPADQDAVEPPQRRSGLPGARLHRFDEPRELHRYERGVELIAVELRRQLGEPQRVEVPFAVVHRFRARRERAHEHLGPGDIVRRKRQQPLPLTSHGAGRSRCAREEGVDGERNPLRNPGRPRGLDDERDVLRRPFADPRPPARLDLRSPAPRHDRQTSVGERRAEGHEDLRRPPRVDHPVLPRHSPTPPPGAGATGSFSTATGTATNPARASRGTRHAPRQPHRCRRPGASLRPRTPADPRARRPPR